MDGTKIAIIDLTWPSAAADSPQVKITLRDACEYAPDPTVAEAVRKHKRLVEQLVQYSIV